MQAVILAGGLGTRIGEETAVRPKPMVEIGGMPILWHILKIYSAAGINRFIICLGYKGYVIKEFFRNYYLHRADVTINLSEGQTDVHHAGAEPWRVTLVDTGADTGTGGRLKAIAPFLDPDQPFCMTYGDGVSDIDIKDLIAFHKAHGCRATVSAMIPPARFGALQFEGDLVTAFQEKPVGDGIMINGGFFVLEPSVLDLVEGPEVMWESAPLEQLARDRELVAYRHKGFWQPMDTLRDKQTLEKMWSTQSAPWKVWKNS